MVPLAMSDAHNINGIHSMDETHSMNDTYNMDGAHLLNPVHQVNIIQQSNWIHSLNQAHKMNPAQGRGGGFINFFSRLTEVNRKYRCNSCPQLFLKIPYPAQPNTYSTIKSRVSDQVSNPNIKRSKLIEAGLERIINAFKRSNLRGLYTNIPS